MMRSIYFCRSRSVLCVLLTLVVFAASIFSPASALAAGQLAAIDGNAAILVDARTDVVLYEQNADEPIAPASTTKIMTALLVVEAIDRGAIRADDMVELTDAVLGGVPSDASRIGRAMVVGEQVSVRELLLMALMESDCVACDMLAVHVSGSVENFVSQMNQRAQQLGCRNTTFKNSHGYPTEGHTSTARSLYLITDKAAEHEMFMEAFGCLKYEMAATNKNENRILYSTDKLLYDPEIVKSTYTVYYRDYVTGGKTGYSRASGNCLVSTAEKDGMQLVSVITGVEMKYPDDQTVIDAFTETDRLLKWGFDNYSSHRIVNEGQVIKEIEIDGGEPALINGVCAQTLYATLEKTDSADTVQVTTVLKDEIISAPVSSGDVMGTVSLVQNGRTLASTSLLASADSGIAPKKFQPNIPLIIILSLIVAAGAGFLVYYTNNNKILLLDLARDKINGTDSGASSRQVVRRPAEKPAPEIQKSQTASKPAGNAFDEFFARNGKEE